MARFVCERMCWFQKRLWEKGQEMECEEADVTKVPRHFTRMDAPPTPSTRPSIKVEPDKPPVAEDDDAPETPEVVEPTNKELIAKLESMGVKVRLPVNKTMLKAMLEEAEQKGEGA